MYSKKEWMKRKKEAFFSGLIEEGRRVWSPGRADYLYRSLVIYSEDLQAVLFWGSRRMPMFADPLSTTCCLLRISLAVAFAFFFSSFLADPEALFVIR